MRVLVEQVGRDLFTLKINGFLCSLPNKQIFVVGGRCLNTLHITKVTPDCLLTIYLSRKTGGNYWFGQGVRYPVLLTPTGKGQFDKGIRVAPHLEDRLYHSNAVLLADGRVFFMVSVSKDVPVLLEADLNIICVSLYQGGNTNRALHRADAGPLGTKREDGTPGQKKFNPSVVERRLYFMGHDNGAVFYGKGSPEQPRTELAESWTAEIYSPPYLFIDGNRRTKINKMSLVSVAEQGLSFIQSIGNKNHYLLHSSMTIEMDLDGLPAEESCTNDRLGTLALIKLASVGTLHNWYLCS